MTNTVWATPHAFGAYAERKGPDQTAYPRSLIRVFAVRFRIIAFDKYQWTGRMTNVAFSYNIARLYSTFLFMFFDKTRFAQYSYSTFDVFQKVFQIVFFFIFIYFFILLFYFYFYFALIRRNKGAKFCYDSIQKHLCTKCFILFTVFFFFFLFMYLFIYFYLFIFCVVIFYKPNVFILTHCEK